jgi:hypothetical protein
MLERLFCYSMLPLPLLLVADADRWRATGALGPARWLGWAQLALVGELLFAWLLPGYLDQVLRHADARAHDRALTSVRAKLNPIGVGLFNACSVLAFALLRAGLPLWQFYLTVVLSVGGGLFWTLRAHRSVQS